MVDWLYSLGQGSRGVANFPQQKAVERSNDFLLRLMLFCISWKHLTLDNLSTNMLAKLSVKKKSIYMKAVLSGARNGLKLLELVMF